MSVTPDRRTEHTVVYHSCTNIRCQYCRKFEELKDRTTHDQYDSIISPIHLDYRVRQY